MSHPQQSAAPQQHAGRFCIIGAGASGLAAAKNFRQRAIPYDLVEREDDIGGLWNIATPSGIVYETTHLVSSAKSSGFDDFPMKVDEDGWIDYPSHAQTLAYLRAYAGHFGVLDGIEFGTTVTRVEPATDAPDGCGDWLVTIAGERAPRRYAGVVIANGHHDKPRMPRIPGRFSGKIMHSREYKSPRQLRDGRVLVVGAGNSGSDIVVDAVHAQAEVTLSMRRGTWFVPKFMLGFPTHDAVAFLEKIPMPRAIKRRYFHFGHMVMVGPPDRHGLPRPDYWIDDAHPTMNDDVVRFAAHGKIVVRPAIERFDGDTVHFTDGTSGQFDTIVFATGYEIEFPFMDASWFLDGEGRAKMFLNTFHPKSGTLFACGLIQANGPIWRLADYQARLIADFVLSKEIAPQRRVWFEAQKSAGNVGVTARRFSNGERHRLEANYFDYARVLRRFDRQFGAARSPKLAVAEVEPVWKQPVPTRLSGRAEPMRAAAE